MYEWQIVLKTREMLAGGIAGGALEGLSPGARA